MAKFRVLRVRRVATAELYEAEGETADDAAAKPGRLVLSRTLSDASTVCSAVVEAERYGEAWLDRQLARLGGGR